MKNIRISISDMCRRTWRKASCYLGQFDATETHAQRLKREERELRARILAFSAGDRRSREATHERGA